MKQYVFSPIGGAWRVSYLTNGLGTNDRLFINEVKSWKNNVTVPGLLSEGQALGLFRDYKERTATEIVAKAVATNLNLSEYHDGKTTATVLNVASSFLTFTIPTATSIVIDHNAGTIKMNIANGTVVTGLVATFTVPASNGVKVGVTAQTSAATVNDFTNPVTYVLLNSVTGGTKNYVVTVTVLPS